MAAKPKAPGEATTQKGSRESKSNGELVARSTVDESRVLDSDRVNVQMSCTDDSDSEFVRLIGPDYFDSDNDLKYTLS